MGISFKVSKTGKRFHPKPLQSDSTAAFDDDEQNGVAIAKNKSNNNSLSKLTGESSENKDISEITDAEASFTLSLFPDGYSIAKPTENESGRQTSIDVPKFLHPYDRASEALFLAIESGRLPGDILDDIPCKFNDGTLVCEVRDYRRCFSEGGPSASSGNGLPPIINRVRLRMSLENIVKDIPAISDDGWTYGDLMEVESRILKALQPQLCLDPNPQLDRLSDKPVPTKLNFELRSMRRKRLRQIIPEVAVSANNIHGKKVCLDRAGSENSRLGDPAGSLVQQPTAYENMNPQSNVPSSSMHPVRNNSFGSDGSLMAKYQTGVGSPRMMRDQQSGSLLNAASASSPGGQDIMIPFADNSHGKRENQDGQSSPLTNKKARFGNTGVPGSNLQHLGPQVDNIQASDLHWKNTLMQQQQSIGRGGVQYANNGMQKFPQQAFEGVGLNQEGGAPMPFTIGQQQGMRYHLKEEPVETDKAAEQSRIMMGESELANIDSRLQQQRMQQQHQFMRSGYQQTPPWNALGHQPLDYNNSRKEEPFQKRKMVQSPRVSAGGLPQSPLSSKSGEFSSGSVGPQFGAAVTSGLAAQKDKSAAVTSLPSAIGGNPSFSNESMQQRQNQAQSAAAKRRTNSLPKTPAINGIGSPASVSNMSVPITANSPPVRTTQHLGDQIMLERFSKIETVTMRCQLNRKKNKVSDEQSIRKSNAYSAQHLGELLSSDLNSENLKDESCKMPLSKSLVGGNMNFCKTRILNFVQTERIIQGNSIQLVPKARTRLIMSEKPNEGAVAIHIGEIEDAEYLAAEDYLPTLANTHIADLLAAQFCSLMVREGYHMEDHVQPRPVRTNSQSNADPAGEMQQQFSEGGVSSQQLGNNDIAKPNISGNNSTPPVNSPHNLLQGQQRMLPPGSSQAIQVSQGIVPGGVSMPARPQQPPEQLQPQQQQQHPQFQRSPVMLQAANSMQHLNNISAQNPNMQQLGPGHMGNKPSVLQLQMLQQQQQQQQQQQPQLLQQQQQQQQQRKMMSSIGNVSMGSIGNNMAALGSLSNVMAISGVRGVGGPGISSPMGPISNMNQQSAMNLTAASSLTNAFRTGTFTPAQAAFMKAKFGQNRSSMLAANNPQSSIGGMMPGGARQMHPGSSGLSMLALNRASINQMQQRTPMGPPKLMPGGMNLYMNQQQQQLQQQQLLQQMQMQQQQQQQQQLQQQQETTSPLQAVLSPPPQVGSPSSMGMPPPPQPQQQQPSPQQQLSQRTPMSPQLSSGGAIHSMSNAGNNPEACPASPQLSSQTLGSVGSITTSPMELQGGVNKSNSVNNA